MAELRPRSPNGVATSNSSPVGGATLARVPQFLRSGMRTSLSSARPLLPDSRPTAYRERRRRSTSSERASRRSSPTSTDYVAGAPVDFHAECVSERVRGDTSGDARLLHPPLEATLRMTGIQRLAGRAGEERPRGLPVEVLSKELGHVVCHDDTFISVALSLSAVVSHPPRNRCPRPRG